MALQERFKNFHNKIKLDYDTNANCERSAIYFVEFYLTATDCPPSKN